MSDLQHSPISDVARAALVAAAGPRGALTDAADIAPYVRDWRGRYTGATSLVLRPATVAGVQAIVRAAAANRVALVAQGGNTGLVGGSVPDASGAMVVLSLSRLNAVRAVAADDYAITVDAGAVLATVQAAALAADRLFPLALGAQGSAQIGGLIATNAGGVQVLRYGTMRALVLGLEAVLADGTVFNGLSLLHKDNTGYDIKQLLIGSEGTLGIITGATLKLFPRPRQTATAFVGLADPQQAVALLARLRSATGDMLSSFELIPAVGLELVLQHIPGTRAPLTGAWPWTVLIEATSPAEGDGLAGALEAALATALNAGRIGDAVVAQNAAQAAAWWKIRETLPEAEKLDGAALKHDVSVPVAAMPRFIAQATAAVVAQVPGARVLAFGHLGDGNVHFNVRPPAGVAPSAFVAAHAEPVARLVNDVIGSYGGAISAEHGIGVLKRAELARTADPAKLAMMHAIKNSLDPLGILNPGRLL